MNNIANEYIAASYTPTFSPSLPLIPNTTGSTNPC